MVMDRDTQYQSLQLQWASHVHCNQRKGRVGRVSDGRVYRLVSESFFDDQMEQTIVPEIQRAPLARIVLCAKMLQFDEPPQHILSLALNPPNLSNVQSAIWMLKEVNKYIRELGILICFFFNFRLAVCPGGGET